MKKNKINWGQKLSSRKFWVALGGFITTLLIAFNIPELRIEQVAAIVASMGTLVAYIVTEGYIDGKRLEEEEEDSKQ